MRSVFAALVIVAACSSPKKVEEKKKNEVDTTAYLAFLDQVTDLVSSESDCKKLAASVDKLVDRNAGLIKSANAAAADHQKFADADQKRIAADVDRMLDGAILCGDDRDLRKAFKKAAPPEEEE